MVASPLRTCLTAVFIIVAPSVSSLCWADDLDGRLQERREAGRQAVEERSRRIDRDVTDHRRLMRERQQQRDNEARRNHDAVKESARQPWRRAP